jgi:hypothetical protein
MEIVPITIKISASTDASKGIGTNLETANPKDAVKQQTLQDRAAGNHGMQ